MNKAIIGKKIGMTQIFLSDGRLAPVTVVEAGPCVVTQVKTAKNPEVFREQHRTELTAYQAAAAYFKAQKITKLPSLKHLETEREQLISEKARFYEAYREAKKAWIELSTAQQNLLSILHREDRQQIQEGGLHDPDIAH